MVVCEICHSIEVRTLKCQHNYCLNCLNKLYVENKRKCIHDCGPKIMSKLDILPFFNDMEDKRDLYDNNIDYHTRVLYLDEYFKDNKRELSNTFIEGDKRFLHLSYDCCKLQLSDFIKVMKNTYIVYEIYEDLIVHRGDNWRYYCLIVSSFLIYYRESKTCFVYKLNMPKEALWNGSLSHILTNEFQFSEILHNIEKDTLDDLYLNNKKSKKYWELLESSKERRSSILNPEGYTQFPKGFKKFHQNYVNHTKDFHGKKKLHNFQNYKWIHFQDMIQFEKKYIAMMSFIRINKKICNELIEEILSFL